MSYKMSCPFCGGAVEVSECQSSAKCPYCENSFKTRNDPQPATPAQEVKKAESPVVAVCHDCKHGIKQDEQQFRYERKKSVRSGRYTHWESEFVVLCKSCYDRQTAADRAEAKRIAEANEEARRKDKRFWTTLLIIGAIIGLAICCFFGYCGTTAGVSFWSGFFIGFAVLVIALIVLFFKAVF